MAAARDPDEILRSIKGRENFQRITRLLISGTCLVRETFDSICPPSNLPTILSNPVTERKLRTARLTRPQWQCLYPSPGVYGKSADFDITLLFLLLRTICNLTPPQNGWNLAPATADHSLTADIVRIKYYRNLLVGHMKQDMTVTDDEFRMLWQEISNALLRIAGHVSLTRKTAWQVAITKCMTAPLTVQGEKSVQESIQWLKSDMNLDKSLEKVNELTKSLEVS